MQQMAVLWLLSYLGGSLQTSSGRDDSRRSRRQRMLPADEWLRERLVTARGDGADEEMLAALRDAHDRRRRRFQTDIAVRGLIRVTQQQCCHMGSVEGQDDFTPSHQETVHKWM